MIRREWAVPLLMLLAVPINAFAQNLTYPINATGAPAAGSAVSVTAPEYQGTAVHHRVYLPPDWNEAARANGRRWPVIVEYTGNYFPAAGSSGEIEGARLGFGISGGRFIWVVLPFVDTEQRANATRWWGNVEATVAYAKQNIPRICEEFGGDTQQVFLCGFSRGAIGVSFIGLHDDEIADLWCGFITHDHFDGLQEWRGTEWGSPLDTYRAAAARRLQRIQGRPLLVCQSEQAGGTTSVEAFLKVMISPHEVSFLTVNTERVLGAFPNSHAIHPHNDAWLSVDSKERRSVWDWVDRVQQKIRTAPSSQ